MINSFTNWNLRFWKYEECQNLKNEQKLQMTRMTELFWRYEDDGEDDWHYINFTKIISKWNRTPRLF